GRDAVGANARHFFGPLVVLAGQLPDPAMIEAELLDMAAANAIGAAIADVGDPGAFGAQDQADRGGAHAAELAVLIAAVVDRTVRFQKRLADGRLGPFLGV